MKSLNDIIWNDDIDLEKGKKGEIGLGMKETCIMDSCSIRPECTIEPPSFNSIVCTGK